MFGARGEHGNCFLFYNLGALRFSAQGTMLRLLEIFIACLFKGSQEHYFFDQTLLFTAFVVTALKFLTYALVST